MYVAESITCPHCNHLDATSHHLFTASLECNCGDFFLAPISKTFRERLAAVEGWRKFTAKWKY